MGNQECLFCRILEGVEPSEIIIEDDEFIAIKDKFPKAPVHILVIPRKHVSSLNEIGELEDGECKRMLEFVVALADKLGIKESGYRLINNVGRGGGQIIFHIHWHVLAGKSLGF